MNLSKERMAHITRLVEGGFPLKTDEVEDLHGWSYHLYCLCDTHEAIKIRMENEIEGLKAENARLSSTVEQQAFLIENLRSDVREAIETDCEQDAIDAIAEIERTGTPGSVIREMNDELVDLRKDAERYRWLRDGASVILSKEAGFTAESGAKIYSTMPSQRELDSAVDSGMEQSHD